MAIDDTGVEMKPGL